MVVLKAIKITKEKVKTESLKGYIAELNNNNQN